MARAALISVLALSLCCAAGFAAVVTLDTGDSIQDAINAAADGDSIVLEPGLYKQRIDFAGKDITIRGTAPANPTVVAATILDGEAGDSVVRFVSGETNAAQLKGLTIIGGYAGFGGGVRCSGASPTIMYNVISGNLSSGGGAGIFCQASAPIITLNVIRQNFTEGAGGGIEFSSCTGGLCQDNRISQNTAVFGGGIYLSGEAPELKRNVVEGNTASSTGGGISIIGGTNLSVRQNVLRDNQADQGGGLCISLSNTRCFNNLLVGNTANEGLTAKGGGMYLSGGANQITSNTLDGNSSGIAAGEDSSAIANCIITNSTVKGGLAAVGFSLPTLRYSDVWHNTGGDVSGITPGPGCFSADPLYATPLFVLKSQAGHKTSTGWVNDWTTSPCIDAGPPGLAFANEPAPNGGRVNMGYEGNMTYASKSISTVLVASVPKDGAMNVNRRTQIVLTFQHLVKQDSAEAHFSMIQGTFDYVTGTFAWPEPNRKMVFTPNAPLYAGYSEYVSLTSGIERLDGSTIALSESRYFYTGSQPVVTALSPTGMGASRTGNILVDFDVPMGHGTTESAFSIQPNVGGVFSWANGSKRLVFNPNPTLAASTQYTVRIAATARSLTGVAMTFPFTGKFTTVGVTSPAAITASAAVTSGGAVQISVNLTAAADVDVTILNLAGRTVALLPTQALESGVSSLLWNGRSASGTKAPAGQYLVKVTARTAEGETCAALAPLRL